MQISFNERGSVLSASSPSGFQLYSVPPSQGFRRLSVVTQLAGASLVSILDETPLVAMVGSNSGANEQQGTDRMLQVFDTSRKEVLSSLFFDSAILNVMMNPKRLIVVRERQTHIFDLNTMQPQSQIATNSPPNRLGLGALSPLTDGGTCYYCYPFTSRDKLSQSESGGGDESAGNSVSSCPGDVVVLEAVGNDVLHPFKAHDHPLVALAISGDGSKIVTASTSGTLIRVFTLQGMLLHQLRRGRRKARITHLAVSFTATIVAVCSDSGTLHLFRGGAEKGDSHRFSSRVTGDITSFVKHTLRPGFDTVPAVNADGTVLSLASIPLVEGEGACSAARATLHQYAIDRDGIKDLGADYPIVSI